MRGFNQIIIVGNLGSDPKQIITSNKKVGTVISVCTPSMWGDKEDKPDWHKVTLWGPLAEIAMNLSQKGSTVMVVGFLTYYDIDGNKKPNIVAKHFNVLKNSKTRGMEV